MYIMKRKSAGLANQVYIEGSCSGALLPTRDRKVHEVAALHCLLHKDLHALQQGDLFSVSLCKKVCLSFEAGGHGSSALVGTKALGQALLTWKKV